MLTPGSRPSAIKTRVGYFEDLTSLPVTYGIDNVVKSAQVRRMPLSEVRELLAEEQLEVALVPVTDAFQLANYAAIPCSCVAAAGASRLFMIFSKQLPTEIKRVLVDPDDFGSVNLAKLLFARKLMVRPEFFYAEQPIDPRQYDLNQDDGFDAYLTTGTSNFYIRKDAFPFSWDLTLAWYEYARMPYVIHCWVTRKGVRLDKLEKELGDVAKRNEVSDDLAQRSSERFDLAQSSVAAVYQKALATSFSPLMVTSMRRLGQELTQAKVMAARPLRLYAAASSRSA